MASLVVWINGLLLYVSTQSIIYRGGTAAPIAPLTAKLVYQRHPTLQLLNLAARYDRHDHQHLKTCLKHRVFGLIKAITSYETRLWLSRKAAGTTLYLFEFLRVAFCTAVFAGVGRCTTINGKEGKVKGFCVSSQTDRIILRWKVVDCRWTSI